MENWERVELFSSFLKLSGDIEVVPPLRLTDVVNRMTEFLEIQHLTLEPLASTYPVISTVEDSAMVAKRALLMVVPIGETAADQGGAERCWRPRWRARWHSPSTPSPWSARFSWSRG